jgi:hypothetical protein
MKEKVKERKKKDRWMHRIKKEERKKKVVILGNKSFVITYCYFQDDFIKTNGRYPLNNSLTISLSLSLSLAFFVFSLSVLLKCYHF